MPNGHCIVFENKGHISQSNAVIYTTYIGISWGIENTLSSCGFNPTKSQIPLQLPRTHCGTESLGLGGSVRVFAECSLMSRVISIIAALWDVPNERALATEMLGTAAHALSSFAEARAPRRVMYCAHRIWNRSLSSLMCCEG